MALVSQGRFAEVARALFPRLVHRERREDAALRAVFDLMAEEVGCAAYLRQQTANIGRPDSRPTLASIRCPTLVLVGDGDELTPPERAAEMARRHRRSAAGRPYRAADTCPRSSGPTK